MQKPHSVYLQRMYDARVCVSVIHDGVLVDVQAPLLFPSTLLFCLFLEVHS